MKFLNEKKEIRVGISDRAIVSAPDKLITMGLGSCVGIALYDNQKNILFVNEINTIPGALSYYLFESKGIYFDELLDKLIISTMKRNYKKNKLINHFESTVLTDTKGLKMKK